MLPPTQWYYFVPMAVLLLTLRYSLCRVLGREQPQPQLLSEAAAEH